MAQNPVVNNEEQDLPAMLQERWDDLIALFFQPQPQTTKGDPSTPTEKPSQQQQYYDDYTKISSDGGDEGSWSTQDDDETALLDDDTHNTVNRELDQLYFDLNITERSIADLEEEFAEDLEGLAEGLETAFEYFDDDKIVQATLQKQEAQMSKSTRSQFKGEEEAQMSLSIRSYLKSGLEESLRKKRKRRTMSTRNAATFPSTESQQRQEQEAKEEEYFQNWFNRFWEAIERLFQLFGAEQQQKNTGSLYKTLSQLWQEI